MSDENVFAVVGKTPEEVRDELERYSELLKGLSVVWPDLLDQYPDRWIVFGEQEVLLDAATLEDALAMADEKGLSRNSIIVRQVETNPALMIV